MSAATFFGLMSQVIQVTTVAVLIGCGFINYFLVISVDPWPIFFTQGEKSMRAGEKSKGRTFYPALMLFSPYLKKRNCTYFPGREGKPKILTMDAVASQLIISQKQKKKYFLDLKIFHSAGNLQFYVFTEQKKPSVLSMCKVKQNHNVGDVKKALSLSP